MKQLAVLLTLALVTANSAVVRAQGTQPQSGSLLDQMNQQKPGSVPLLEEPMLGKPTEHWENDRRPSFWENDVVSHLFKKYVLDESEANRRVLCDTAQSYKCSLCKVGWTGDYRGFDINMTCPYLNLDKEGCREFADEECPSE
jgi:hypothetical protein